mmetsp:Transcript_150634/g.263274  ORF Transcript_150634/g.263274 Transcript_150634/m.263274 type:complete len:342 (+) Transcript_150634:91-1116(+)
MGLGQVRCLPEGHQVRDWEALQDGGAIAHPPGKDDQDLEGLQCQFLGLSRRGGGQSLRITDHEGGHEGPNPSDDGLGEAWVEEEMRGIQHDGPQEGGHCGLQFPGHLDVEQVEQEGERHRLDERRDTALAPDGDACEGLQQENLGGHVDPLPQIGLHRKGRQDSVQQPLCQHLLLEPHLSRQAVDRMSPVIPDSGIRPAKPGAVEVPRVGAHQPQEATDAPCGVLCTGVVTPKALGQHAQPIVQQGRVRGSSLRLAGGPGPVVLGRGGPPRTGCLGAGRPTGLPVVAEHFVQCVEQPCVHEGSHVVRQDIVIRVLGVHHQEAADHQLCLPPLLVVGQHAVH